MAPPQPPLLSPASLGQARAATQVLQLAYGEREVTLQCVVEDDASAMTLIALGPLGQRIMTLRYDGHSVQTQTDPYVPSGLDSKRVLTDVQLALWPLRAWQDLGDGDWTVTEPQPGLRRLHYRGRLVAEVHYDGGDAWSSRLWLVNLSLGYTLQIEPQP